MRVTYEIIMKIIDLYVLFKSPLHNLHFPCSFSFNLPPSENPRNFIEQKSCKKISDTQKSDFEQMKKSEKIHIYYPLASEYIRAFKPKLQYPTQKYGDLPK